MNKIPAECSPGVMTGTEHCCTHFYQDQRYKQGVVVLTPKIIWSLTAAAA